MNHNTTLIFFFFFPVTVELQIPFGLSIISPIKAKNNQRGLLSRLKHPVLDIAEHALRSTLV